MLNGACRPVGWSKSLLDPYAFICNICLLETNKFTLAKVEIPQNQKVVEKSP